MLEVFQDLTLRGDPALRSVLAAELAGRATGPWSHDAAREEIMAKFARSAEILPFVRDDSDPLPPATLILRQCPDGYEVTNIMPRTSGSFSFGQYNALLKDFVGHVAALAADKHGFTLDITPSHVSLDEIAGHGVAKALRHFSNNANKATGSAHPLDAKRWHAFVIAAFQEANRLTPDMLARWLIEEAGWNRERAAELAIEYEQGLSLLRTYNQAPELIGAA